MIDEIRKKKEQLRVDIAMLVISKKQIHLNIFSNAFWIPKHVCLLYFF